MRTLPTTASILLAVSLMGSSQAFANPLKAIFGNKGEEQSPMVSESEPVDQTATVVESAPIAEPQPTTETAPAADAQLIAGAESTEIEDGATPPDDLTPVHRTISWRNRYELGPGDQLNFALHGQPKAAKLAVPVAPDWTISFLQAKQVSVRGKTIDELRDEMNQILIDTGQHRNPRVIITPAKLGSKKFTILGEVRKNGTYPLDSPVTLLQALAAAGGFNLGISGEDATELADLERSFIVRHGQRYDVDMEALYLNGDMTQNIYLEPNDYIYIASRVRNEVFVFGSVPNGGVRGIEPGMTVTGAIASAGGFNRYAWRNRVMVIRGSLNAPQVMVVQLNGVFHGKAQDMVLEPGDIVYVHNRPWAVGEQLLDTAILAYIDGTVAGAVADSDVAVSTSGAAF